MLRTLRARAEHWPLNAPFRIARGVKTAADVVAVTIECGTAAGRGEAVPYARYGETLDSVLEQIASVGKAIQAGADRTTLAALLPAGAARNALDCALWDLEAQQTGVCVAERLGEPDPGPLVSALTVSLDTPVAMGTAAARIACAKLIKVKVDREHIEARLLAVRRAAPKARLIVDPNESWAIETLQSIQPVLAELKVDLVEQPLPAGEDASLAGFASYAPICADESCHTVDDLAALKGRYQVVNIKLDKTGGLSGALDLLAAARREGFGVMVGCMVSSSMSIAPAFHVARHADFVDLDGPIWLAQDHAGGAWQDGPDLHPPRGLWGEPNAR
jgi:L-alanine-DL-glutamate epimerase-like enolase superfamily enzyme